ncbi:hypothetical protein GY45DRAFT_1435099 [Cubamyces sp. BRFM 1775]|nr:hypothetical protein GY45DRAFT_1435099 [Cubamyces sp. BRFM 1775]
MEKKPSKTYQRLRKLSDSIIQAFKPAPPPRTIYHNRNRRVSTHDIGGPSPHELLSPVTWLRPDDSHTRPVGRQLRPSVEQLAPPVRDLNAPRRPERPRDLDDLPYGAKGCIKLSDAPWLRVDSPGPSRSVVNLNSVPFPSAPRPREPTYSPFATTGRATPASPRTDKGKGKAREVEGPHRDDYRPEEPATVRRQGAIRRTSRTSDAATPPSPLQSRSVRNEYGYARDREDPAIGLQRSRSMATPRPPRHSPVDRSQPFDTSVSTRAPHRPGLRGLPHEHEDARFNQLPNLFSGASRSTEGSGSDGPMQMPHAPVVTPRVLAQEQASMPLRHSPKPRTVKVSAQESIASLEAQVVRPRQPPREPVPLPSNHAREPPKIPPSSSKGKEVPRVAQSSTRPSAAGPVAARAAPAANKEREREREQSRPLIREKPGRTVEHYPMTYFYEEVRRGTGALQLDLGAQAPAPPVPSSSGAHNHAHRQEGAQVQAYATAPLQPRRRDREAQGAPRERPEGPRQSRR